MSIDTTTPRSRRAILAGAIGGALASIGLMAKPETAYAGSDGDVVLDAQNTGAGTTEILAASSNPALKVTGGAVGIQAAGGIGVDAAGDPAVNAISTGAGLVGVVGWSQGQGAGVIGWSTNGAASSPTPSAKTGLHGISTADDTAALGVKGEATTGTGVRGTATTGTGVQGFSGAGSVPTAPAKTAVYGEATVDAAARGVYGKTTSGQGVRGEATSGVGVQGVASNGAALRGDAATGFALDATSTGGSAVRGTGGLDGVIGQSAGNRSGVVGFSGGSAPAGPTNTGVYGEANQDSTAHGVWGKSTAGQGVRGDATSGVGVRAVASTGIALAVTGRVTMNRSGKVTIATGIASADVTVPGGLASTALAFANIQYGKSGVWVIGVRPNYPTTGKIRIYLNKAATSATPVAWWVLG